MKRHEEIQKLAYELFKKNGRFHGRDIDHWLEAERIIKARQMDMHAADIEAASSKNVLFRGLMQEGMRQKKVSGAKRAR